MAIKGRVKQDLRIITSVLKIIWSSSKKWTIIRIGLLFIQGLLPLITLFLLKQVIDTIVEISTNQGNEELLDRVILLIGFWTSANIVSAIVTSLSKLITTAQEQALADHIQFLIHNKSVNLDYEYYEDPKYHDTAHRAQNESLSRCTALISSFDSFMKSTISLFGILALIFSLHWSIFLIIIIVVIPSALVRLKYSKKIYLWKKKRTSLNRQSSYFSKVLTGANYAKEIRIFGWGNQFMNDFRRLRRKLFSEKLRIDTLWAKRNSIAGVLEASSIGASYVIIIFQGVGGSITIGSIVMFIQAVQKGQGFLKTAVTAAIGIYEHKMFLEYLFEFLNLKPKYSGVQCSKKIPEEVNHIELQNVNFQYPFTGTNALTNINLSINKSQVVGIVGANGSGKSTLIKLICKLYSTSVGQILVNGISINEFETTDYQRLVTVTFQDFAKYNGSFVKNITGQSAKNESEKFTEASKISGIDKLIESFDSGQKTKLGKLFKGGKELSGGQWQRVALARALYKNSPIIILDEATSQLDGEAESQLINSLHGIKEGKIILLTSHRLTNIIDCDQIVVMGNGKIVGTGTHAQLSSSNQYYKDLFSKQLKFQNLSSPNSQF
ncbi:MAG: ABC transporter ATP-binding protein [Cyclobacteriaceae bacterium]